MASRAAVIVPIHKDWFTKSERFSFCNTLKTLANHDIYVACPKRLVRYIGILQNDFDTQFRAEFFNNNYFKSIAGYNHLLMPSVFYRKYANYEYLLIVQTDALAISDQLDTWCNRGYSYIGAPWFYGFHRPREPISFIGVGNGGFSLRKVDDHLRVLSIPRYIPYKHSAKPITQSLLTSPIECVRQRFTWSYGDYSLHPEVNEDWFWGKLVPKRCSFFIVPEPEDAISFSFEVLPDYLYKLNGNRLPFGCHAWEKYNPAFWRDALRPAGIDIP